MKRSLARLLAAPAFVLALLAGAACESSAPAEAPLDTRLVTHAVVVGAPSSAGLAYVEAVADAHEQADADPERSLEPLLAALEPEPPANDGSAELLHYELLARATELLLARGESERVLELLEDRLSPSTSLPIDRASARCLVALGDAGAHTGDLALAMGSYARALDMLTLLLEEVES